MELGNSTFDQLKENNPPVSNEPMDSSNSLEINKNPLTAGSKLSEAIAKLALEQGWGSAEIDEAINGLQRVKISTTQPTATTSQEETKLPQGQPLESLKLPDSLQQEGDGGGGGKHEEGSPFYSPKSGQHTPVRVANNGVDINAVFAVANSIHTNSSSPNNPLHSQTSTSTTTAESSPGSPENGNFVFETPAKLNFGNPFSFSAPNSSVPPNKPAANLFAVGVGTSKSSPARRKGATGTTSRRAPSGSPISKEKAKEKARVDLAARSANRMKAFSSQSSPPIFQSGVPGQTKFTSPMKSPNSDSDNSHMMADSPADYDDSEDDISRMNGASFPSYPHPHPPAGTRQNSRPSPIARSRMPSGEVQQEEEVAFNFQQPRPPVSEQETTIPVTKFSIGGSPSPVKKDGKAKVRGGRKLSAKPTAAPKKATSPPVPPVQAAPPVPNTGFSFSFPSASSSFSLQPPQPPTLPEMPSFNFPSVNTSSFPSFTTKAADSETLPETVPILTKGFSVGASTKPRTPIKGRNKPRSSPEKPKHPPSSVSGQEFKMHPSPPSFSYDHNSEFKPSRPQPVFRHTVSQEEEEPVQVSEEEDVMSEESEGEVHAGDRVAWGRTEEEEESQDEESEDQEEEDYEESGSSESGSYDEEDIVEEENIDAESESAWNSAAKRAEQDVENMKFYQQQAAKQVEEEMKKESIKKAEEMMNKARSLYQLGNREGYVKAVECFSAAVHLAPADWDGHVKCIGNRAACYMMQGNMTATIEDCKTVLTETPDNLKIRNRLGSALLKIGSLTQSNEAFESVRKKVADERKFSLSEDKEMDKCEAEANEGIQSVFKLKDAMEKAYGAQRKSEHDKAAETASIAISIAPYCFKMYAVRATASYKHQKWSDCVDECMRCALALTTSNPKLLDKLNRDDEVLRGKVDSDIISTMKLDRKDKVNFGILTCGRIINAKMFQMLVPSLRYSERCGDAENLLTVISMGRKDEMLNAWCISEINKIESLRQGKESGDAAFRRGKYHAAIALYSDAIALDPKASSVNAVLYCNRAAAHMALEKYEAAYNDCNKALSLRPSYPKAKLRRARAALKTPGRLSESISDFESYLSEILQNKVTYASDDSYSAVSAELTAVKATQRRNEKAREESADFKSRFDNFGAGYNAGYSGTRANGFERKAPQRRSDRSSDTRSAAEEFYESRKKERDKAHARSASVDERSSSRQTNSSKPSQPNPKNVRSPVQAFSSTANHYTVLGVEQSATEGQIKKAYLKLALKFHPDKNKEVGAEDKFKRIVEAKEILSDASQRLSYDSELRRKSYASGGSSSFSGFGRPSRYSTKNSYNW